MGWVGQMQDVCGPGRGMCQPLPFLPWLCSCCDGFTLGKGGFSC